VTLPTIRIQAPAKINLCLYLGPRRADGLHLLCSLFAPLTLCDTLEVSEAERDEVVCPGVEGENLAARALAGLRERGWEHPPMRIEIEKRIPVAAGLGGGSADAAAVLRLAKGQVKDLESLAMELGSDVPSQLDPMFALVYGAGELIHPMRPQLTYWVVLLSGGGGLSTAEVFAEADRLGLARTEEKVMDVAQWLSAVPIVAPTPFAYEDILVNDLEEAALSLRPEIGEALEALDEVGASHTLLTGSGPTAFGLFYKRSAAEEAAARLDRDDAIVCEAGRSPL
jgi:4-diphosphocytidyl-2-C-methyl-D-erythritol kinase